MALAYPQQWRKTITNVKCQDLTCFVSCPNALANLALVRSALLALLPDHFPHLSLPQIKERLHSRPAACLFLLRKK